MRQHDNTDNAFVYDGEAPTIAAQQCGLDDVIEHMVRRFLQWKLPDDFNPDGGISFTKVSNIGTSYEYKHEPVGTNLFDYNQAKAMVLHMLEGSAIPASGAGWRDMESALRRANVLIGLLTVRQVIEAGDAAIEAAGLNPWCINEGLADGSERISPSFIEAILPAAPDRGSCWPPIHLTRRTASTAAPWR